MPRKFRHSRPKNYERKKQRANNKVTTRSPTPPRSPSLSCTHTSSLTPTLQELHASMPALRPGWTDQTTSLPLQDIKLCKVSCQPSSSSSLQPMFVSHSLTITSDLTWKAYVSGHDVTSKIIAQSPLSANPRQLNSQSFSALLLLLDTVRVCPGHPEIKFQQMSMERKGKFSSTDGRVVAYEDAGFSVSLNGEVFDHTIRTTDCDVIFHEGKCPSCQSFRPTLRAMHSRWLKKPRSPKTPQKSTNHRFLNTPEKLKRIEKLQSRTSLLEKEVKVLKERIAAAAIPVDEALSRDLATTMEENNEALLSQFPAGSFQRLFWEQQLQATRVSSNMKQMRWHPVMVKWCLNLKLLSSSSYHALRTTGFMHLPSERTLRDYTHYVKARSGFQDDVDEDLKREANIQELPDWKKHIVVLIDEMKIKENLVYDKHETKIIGFVDIGDVSNQLYQLECLYTNESATSHPSIATHMLVLMVRGIFFHIEYPYAHFPTHRLTSSSLFSIMWEGIERLEELGFKVLAITGDGASTNRKFFKMHSNGSEGPCYKTPNPYTSEERSIFFFSDVPHLLKTTRNCWSHSGGKRKLWINGKKILWSHLENLYKAKENPGQGLHLLHKLKFEHVRLTSFSRMRVDLAAQVLSESVAHALQFYADPDTTETQRFVRTFDKFFDCLNVRSPSEYIKKRKENLQPYTSADDRRLCWLEKDFLGYLDEWESSVAARDGFTAGEKAMMTLSRETIEGLRLTVSSFVEATRYLLTFPSVQEHYILSERFSQDPLEDYFSRQRAKGGRCDNPTAQSSLQAAQSLRVQGSLALQPVRGNCSRKRRLYTKQPTIDNCPIPKRPRHK